MNLFKILVTATITTIYSMQSFSQTSNIRVNQIGYYANQNKIAFVANKQAKNFDIKDAKTNTVVYSNSLSDEMYWNLSEENLQIADFSNFNKIGTYYLSCGEENSYLFTITDQRLFRPISQAALKAFYYWRASTDLLPQHATFNGINYSRKMGHPDTQVSIHKSAANPNRPEGTIVSAPKGWYDAGDYNLYVVNAGITYHALALAYEMYPEYYKQLSLNIPESGNGVPDILNEMKWELDWLFAMQDGDGGVYNKLSSLSFCSMIMPDEDKLDRYMIGKSTSAALDFAAIMAMSARIFAEYEHIFPNISEKALVAAERAWNWAVANPEVYYNNPIDVHTGNYKDSHLADEKFWAASELFITTGKQSYYNELDFSEAFTVPEWHTVNTLGLMSLTLHKEKLPETSEVLQQFKTLTDSVFATYKTSVNKVPIDRFNWGSNGMISSAGAILGMAYKEYNDEKYHEAVISTWNYLMGCNPTGYCFVSGFGSNSPKHFHDRRSTAYGIDEPIPGYIAGGSTNVVTRDCGEKRYPSTAPAACYLDKICSFSTNEIAINWNAPFALLAGMLDNL